MLIQTSSSCVTNITINKYTLGADWLNQFESDSQLAQSPYTKTTATSSSKGWWRIAGFPRPQPPQYLDINLEFQSSVFTSTMQAGSTSSLRFQLQPSSRRPRTRRVARSASPTRPKTVLWSERRRRRRRMRPLGASQSPQQMGSGH